jgi:phage-related protein
MNNLQGEMNRTESEMGQAKAALKELGDAEGKAGKETDDLKEKAAKLSDGLKGALVASAKAAGVAVAALAAAAAAGVAGLASASAGAAQYADEILTAATNTHLSTDALQSYAYAAELMDVSLETFEKSLSRNIKSMDAAREGTGAQAEAYARLGVAVTDANGNLRDGEQVYWDTIDALAGIEDETERDAASLAIFGRSAQELNSLIATGSDGFKAYSDEAQKMGAVMSGDQLERLGAFDDTMQRLNSTVGASRNALGLALLPVLDSLGTQGVDALGAFNNALLEADGDMSKLGPAISGLVSDMVGMIAEAAPMMMQTGVDIVLALIQGIVTNAPALATSAVDISTQLIIGIVTMLPQMLEAGLQILTALIQGIAQNLPAIIPVVVEAVTGIVQALIDNLPLLLDAGLQLLMGLAQGIIEALPALIEQLPQIIEGLVSFFAEAIPTIIEVGLQLLLALIEAMPEIIAGIVAAMPQIIDSLVAFFTGPGIPAIIQAGIQLLVALIKALPQIISTIVQALPQIISSIVSAIIAAVPQIIQTGVELLTSLVKNIGSIASTIVGKVKEIPTKVISAIKGFIGDMVGAGGDLIGGLVRGLGNAAGAVVRKIKDICSGALDAIKNFFGISSPSKVMMRMGEFVGEGFNIGMGDELDKMHGVLQDKLSFDAGTIKAKVVGTADVAGAAAYGAQAPAVTNNNRFSLVINAETMDASPAIRDAVMTIFSEVNQRRRMGIQAV